jgi:hypothetical protein
MPKKAETPELVRKRWRLVCDGEDDLRKLQLEDKKFAAGEHWPEQIKREREKDGRPCLVIDHLKPQMKQVTNQQRAMRPAIQVAAVDSNGDADTAEVLQGIIRNIETNSDADDAYDQAGKDQVEIGRGWIRVRTEYCDDDSGNHSPRCIVSTLKAQGLCFRVGRRCKINGGRRWENVGNQGFYR